MSAFDVDVRRIDTPALSMEYGLVPWDSEIFGVPVAQVSNVEVREPAGAAAAFAGFETWRDQAGVRLVSCRLPHGRLRESMLLEARGYRFVEMVCSPAMANLQAVPLPADDVEVVHAGEGDLPQLEAVAAEAFVTGRYHLDPRLHPALSASRYRYWVKSSFANPRHATLVARLDGRIAGFFIVERTSPERCYWHLTAIAPGFQGRGVGKRVWRAIMHRHQREGVARIDTLISLHNTPVLNLYARLGFSFAEPSMTFHWVEGEALGAPGGRQG